MIKHIKKFLRFFAAAIITLFLFEIYFQATEISLPSTVQDDSTFGRSFRPNERINLIRESFYMGKVNKYGYLGPAYGIKKPENTIRIALIGDSFVEGIQVADKFHFRNILEQELKAQVNDKLIEVLNFGRSGLDFRKMYIYYELLAKKYNPDIVFIFVNESDFRTKDNNLGPDLKLTKNDKLEIDFGFVNSKQFQNKIKSAYLRNFSMYSLLQADYANYNSGNTFKILLDKFYYTNLKNNEEETVTKYNFDNDEFANLNELILKNLSTESSGTRFIIVPIDKMSERYNQLISKYAIEIAALTNVYNNLEKQGINPFYWNATNKYGHWNQQAHNYIGNYLANYILAKHYY